MQLSVIIVLLGVMMEIVEFGDSYRYVRPYKFYNPHPWRPPRWHPFPKTSKRTQPKRTPTHKRHPYEPDYRRQAPVYDDSANVSDAEKPYVIVIQLPQRKEKHKSPYQRLHVAKPAQYSRDTDYIEDELKVYQLDNKKVQIKVNDRFSVFAS